ncbi:MAG: hypothetical protein JOZ54_09830 [Acidobacteria bacterium]|nr:hypothetical protein [Acidobacteriota bacterium]
MCLGLFVALLTAWPAAAVRYGFKTVDVSGNRVEATVCVFSSAGSPLQQWFGSSTIRCFPSTSVVAFPNGDWTFYAVQPGKAASFHSYRAIVRDDPRNTDTGFKQVQMDLAPAGKATLSSSARRLKGDDRIALYFPRSAKTVPFVIPNIPDEGYFTVPIGLPFLPIEYELGGRPVRVGNLHAGIAANDSVVLDDFDAAPGTDVLSAVSVSCRPKELTAANASELPPPAFALRTSDGKQSISIVPTGRLAAGDLVVFKNAPATTDATIIATGSTWEPSTKTVALAPNTLTVVPSLELIPAGALRVQLSATAEDWVRTVAEKPCGDRDARKRDVVLRLSSTGGASLRTLPLGERDLVFDQLRADTYALSIESVGFRSVYDKRIVVKTGEQTVEIAPDLTSLSGTVMRHGRPVHASLQLNELTATTNSLGWYAAYRPSDVAWDRALIWDCETGAQFVVFPSREALLSNNLDVELPDAHSVRVLDDDTSKPIGEALITISVPSPEDPRELLYNRGQRADGSGFALLATTPLGNFRLCASAEGYEEDCRLVNGERETSLRLRRKDTLVGKIVGAGSVTRAMLLFVSPEGAIRETAAVRADGTFRHERPHGAGELAIFVSVDHPLFVLPVPPAMPLTIELPSVPIRSFDVMTDGKDDYEIGIAIGDVIVPSAALSRHQAARGAGAFTVAGRLTIADIAATAPITVYKGFSRSTRPPTVASSVDIFARPELVATFARRIVPANASTVVLP